MVNIISMYMPLLNSLMKMAGMKSKQVEIEPGTVLHFWVPTKNHQNQTKPCVVFLHGFGFNGILTWQFQVLALSKKYAVYIPDLLFFGKSTTDKAGRSPAFQAEVMAKGLRKLGVEKCTLVGYSYGGMVGFKMAAMYPELVESMVVTSSVMETTESVSRAVLERNGLSSWVPLMLPDSAKALKQQMRICSYKLPWLPKFFFKHILKTMFNNRKERTELLEATVTSDKDFFIHHYPQKIYLMWGEKDRIFNLDQLDSLKKQLGNKAAVCCIEKAGHLVQAERPQIYNRHLNQFLASLHHKNC